jgi:hypothetical protein
MVNPAGTLGSMYQVTISIATRFRFSVAVIPITEYGREVMQYTSPEPEV